MKQMKQYLIIVMAIVIYIAICSGALAQSSSLYVAKPVVPTLDRGMIVNTAQQAASFTAIVVPEPRKFAKHDLITIVIIESSSSKLESTLDTEKNTGVDGSISAFPHFNLTDLLNGRLRASDSSDNTPTVKFDLGSEFKGSGEYERKDEMSTRLTGQVVDVKPNGILAIEARKEIRNDGEVMVVMLTGYVREADINIDNTVLSTQIYDLRVSKQHSGELRKSTKKGFISKLLNFLFPQ